MPSRLILDKELMHSTYVTLNIGASGIRLLAVKGREVGKWGSMGLAPGGVRGGLIRQPKVVGIHFMNPVPVMKGVEVIVGRHTSTETLQTAKDFVTSLGKEPCEAMDYAGFIVSRIIDAMMNEAFNCVMDGNEPEQVDKAMKLCCNFPMGPLELCDLAGADIVLHGLETMQKEFGERLRPSPLLVSMVRSGDLGRKTGRGFYDYSSPK